MGKKGSILVIILIGTVVVLSLGSAGYLFLQNRQLQSQLVKTPSPAQNPASVPTIDPMVNWKTFIGKGNNLSFKYPDDYPLPEERSNYISIISPLNSNRGKGYELQNGELKIEVYFSDAQPNDNTESYVKEMNKSLANVDGKVLETKDISIDNTYAIRQKVEGLGVNYVFYLLKNGKRIQIAKYPAETTRDPEFDQILSTFKFL